MAMRVPLRLLATLEQTAGIRSYSVAHRAAMEMDKTRFDTRTDSVHAGLGLPSAYTGAGVLVGITDWGFNYMHPNFFAGKRSEATHHVLRAWDQFKNAGPAPEGFDYGTEYTSYAQMTQVEGDTFGLYGYGSHGTHVAGIIGGNGVGGKYIGQAPNAQLLMGSWRLDEQSWMDEVAWMYNVAKREGKRLVINSSWGMYTFSNLDGSSLLSQAINHYADSGVIFVTSAGNNGSTRFHLQHQFNGSDTLRTFPQWTTLDNGVGQALICWGTPDHDFQISFAITLRDTTYYSPWFSTQSNTTYDEGLLALDGDTVRYDYMSESNNANDHRPHILLNVDKVRGGTLHLFCTSDSGSTVDLWNVGNVQNHAGNTGFEFLSQSRPGYTTGDNAYAISEPGCAAKTLTIAAHNADFLEHDSLYRARPIAYFSSHGPAYGDHVAKPEVSAPGVDVVSSVSALDTTSNYRTNTVVYMRPYVYKWYALSGTSMASPAVAGIVALMLEANPHLTFEQVHDILISTCRNDAQTGPLLAHDSISPVWGYGKVDALRAVSAAYDLLDIREASSHRLPVVVYPNPTHGSLTVQTGTNEPATISITNLAGLPFVSTTARTIATFDVSRWPKGVYLVRVQTRVGSCTEKVVVQ